MAQAQTTSRTISELREFASFTAEERLFIERSLDIFMGRGDAFKEWQARGSSSSSIRGQYIAYRELRALRGDIPAQTSLEGISDFIGAMVRIAAHDLAQEQISSFSAFRFLYERLLGAEARPFLPAAFCAASALPHIRPERRKILLQSLSEAAATAPAWSSREPDFFPERIDEEVA